MERLVVSVIQYGLAGVALWMMYAITYNHPVAIERILLDIKNILATN